MLLHHKIPANPSLHIFQSTPNPRRRQQQKRATLKPDVDWDSSNWENDLISLTVNKVKIEF